MIQYNYGTYLFIINIYTRRVQNEINIQQETPQCDENQVFNDLTKYLCDRNKK